MFINKQAPLSPDNKLDRDFALSGYGTLVPEVRQDFAPKIIPSEQVPDMGEMIVLAKTAVSSKVNNASDRFQLGCLGFGLSEH